MSRLMIGTLFAFAILTPALPAQEGIQRGKVKKVDAAKGLVTITADGKDREFRITEQTLIAGAPGRDALKALKDGDIKEGAAVMFKAEEKDGKQVLIGLKLADGAGAGSGARTLPKVDSSKLKPLTELGKGEYQGFKGGLYPDGKNERPTAHEAAGVALAKQVQPLDADGKPSENGKIVLLSVGMSNTSQSSDGFRRQLQGEKDKNPHVLFVNGAQGGMTAQATQNPEDKGSGTRYWTTVDERLKSAGVSRAQVQAVWIKQADAGPNQGFPGYAQKLQAELTKIVQLLPGRFPNIRLVYLSSRTYGGYAKTPLNPEPYAYESGFAVKWLIEQQIKGDPMLNFDPKNGTVKAPWLSWGPYLWANGSTKRSDGFSYDESDFSAGDGTHQSPSGQEKVGKLLLQFFKSDSTTRPWFLGESRSTEAPRHPSLAAVAFAGEEKKEEPQKSGAVVGVVAVKGDNWLEVKADGEEKARRYVPSWVGGAPAAGGGPDKEMVKVIKGLKVGSRVRLEWKFEERPRVVKVEVLKAAEEKGTPEKSEKKDPEKKGSVAGSLTAKGENWIEIKADGEEKARKYYLYMGGAKEVRDAIKDAAVGSRVRIDWLFHERPRVVKMEVIKAAEKDR